MPFKILFVGLFVLCAYATGKAQINRDGPSPAYSIGEHWTYGFSIDTPYSASDLRAHGDTLLMDIADAQNKHSKIFSTDLGSTWDTVLADPDSLVVPDYMPLGNILHRCAWRWSAKDTTWEFVATFDFGRSWRVLARMDRGIVDDTYRNSSRISYMRDPIDPDNFWIVRFLILTDGWPHEQFAITEDGGRTWRRMNVPTPTTGRGWHTDFLFDRRNRNRYYIKTWPDRSSSIEEYWGTTDNGEHWHPTITWAQESGISAEGVLRCWTADPRVLCSDAGSYLGLNDFSESDTSSSARHYRDIFHEFLPSLPNYQPSITSYDKPSLGRTTQWSPFIQEAAPETYAVLASLYATDSDLKTVSALTTSDMVASKRLLASDGFVALLEAADMTRGRVWARTVEGPPRPITFRTSYYYSDEWSRDLLGARSSVMQPTGDPRYNVTSDSDPMLVSRTDGLWITRNESYTELSIIDVLGREYYRLSTLLPSLDSKRYLAPFALSAGQYFGVLRSKDGRYAVVPLQIER